MADTLKETTKRLQSTWIILVQVTIWIAAVIAGFLIPPPVGTMDERQIWVRFAQFFITIIIGFLLLAMLRWKRKKDAIAWAGVSLVFLVLSTTSFFSYQLFAARWSAKYNNESVVIGSTYSPAAREYHNQNPNLTPDDLIMHYAGSLEKIWTRESLQQRRLLLAAMYVVAMPLFTVCLMSILQAIQCATPPPTRKRPAAAPSVHQPSAS
jgi:hypothetical protein